MKALLFVPLGLLILCLAGSSERNKTEDISSKATKKPSGELFDNDDLLNIKLTGNVRDAFNDRSDKPKYQSFSLYYTSPAGTEARAPVRLRTRGHFRKDKSN